MKRYHLNRDSNARAALFKSQVGALIRHESIETTSAKARAVRSIFEKLLTRAKTGTLAARRHVQSYVQAPELVKKLLGDIAPRYHDVKGGYTSLKVIGSRRGDRAPIVRLSIGKKTTLASGAIEHKPTTPKSRAKKGAPAVAPAPVVEKSVKQPIPTRVHSTGRIGFRQGER